METGLREDIHNRAGRAYGIHRRSLYDTFGDKHKLFLKAMNRYSDKVNAALPGEFKHSKTAAEALQFFLAILYMKKRTSPSGCLMVNSAVELAARDVEVDSKVTEALQQRSRCSRKLYFGVSGTVNLLLNMMPRNWRNICIMYRLD